MNAVYRVCIPHTHRDYFEYSSAEDMPCIGARVWVPFRTSTRLGVVLHETTEQQTPSALKSIESIIDKEPILPPELLALCHWIGHYYQSPLSEVIPLVLPKVYRLGKSAQLPMSDAYELACSLEEAQALVSKRAHKQWALIDFLNAQKGPIAKQTLTDKGFSSSQIMALLHAKIIAHKELPQKPFENPKKANAKSTPLPLNAEQSQAYSSIMAHLHHYQCFLLQGVTGSGKTEVYLQVIAEVLKQGKQVLVLVPEIGLTPQLLSRFTERFDEPLAVIHSNLNESARQIAWQSAKEHKVDIIIGTRSAVFTPMPHLGLIIIDEEHDASLKQMEGVRYSARDTALMRAHLAHIPIILGSATPSLESMYNCTLDKYTLLPLNHKALSTKPLHYQLIDCRTQVLKHGIATQTLNIIKEHLNQNNQVLVFINRRGFAPVVLCHQCGWMADCRACDSHMTLHKKLGQIVCHHCGLTHKAPVMCHRCKSHDLIPIGSGTQRIYDFLSTEFPNTQMLRVDRDQVQQKHALDKHLHQIYTGEVQLIVGTQMLAKGHHVPRLTLVVILDADAGLYHVDFRAIEHLGQLITQVAGRAGRAELAGEVVIQTHAPEHPMLNLLIQQGYNPFAQALLSSRQLATLPPFHFLAIIRAQGASKEALLTFLAEIKAQLHSHGLSLMGPAPAPLPRKNNHYRMQLLIKSSSRRLLNHALTNLREWITLSKKSSSIRWNIDVDPMDLS